MTRLATSFVLGYHGCDEAVGVRVLNGDTTLKPSNEDNDWLGPGTYFWENDPTRAREWAESKVAQNRYQKPFVLGAVVDLRNCLDLLVRDNLDLLAVAHEDLVARLHKNDSPLPENEDASWDKAGDKLKRYLDCAVIRNVHYIVDQTAKDKGSSSPVEPFDTVRGLFTEGGEAYPGGRFMMKSHTQIAVRTDACILGYFLPRSH